MILTLNWSKRCLVLLIFVTSFFNVLGQQNISKIKKLPFADFYRVREGIPHTYDRILNKKSVTIAFLGGSITFNPGWRQMVCDYLTHTYSDTHFQFIAAGIPSLGSLPHAFRLERDVLDSAKVDLLFVEAAVNDRVNGTDSLTQIRDLEGILRHALKFNPRMDVIFMAFADQYKNSDYDRHFIPNEVKNQELVAEHYHLPSINFAREVHDKIANGEFSWDSDFQDMHPAPFGQKLYFKNIKSLLEDCLTQYLSGPVRKSKKRIPPPLDYYNFNKGRLLDVQRAEYQQGWHLVHNWLPKDQTSTRPGFVCIPVLESERPAGELTLTFKGTAVGIGVISGPDAGSISYSIDEGPNHERNLFTPWSSGLHLPWFLLLGAGMKDTEHVLRIQMIEQKDSQSKGDACRIFTFLLNL